MLAGACDQGSAHDQKTSGPNVSVQGVNIGKGKPALAIDDAIRIQFDRLLLPSSVTRQAVTLFDANNAALSPVVSYDPVARVVTISKPDTGTWLLPNQPYKVILHVAQNDADGGLRAIDRAPLFAGDPNLEIGFLTKAPAGTPYAEPDINFCNDVLPIFQRSCTAPICHGAPTTTTDTARFGGGTSRPAAGLLLETSAGILNTVISRVANGSNTGALAGRGEPPGRVFGIDMPLVDPGAPANSWLLYKVLLATPGAPPKAVRSRCNGTAGKDPLAPFTPADFAKPMDDTERAVLNDFVLGREMPYPDMSANGPTSTNPGLTFDELERLRLWIAKNAPVQECGACDPSPPSSP